MDTYLDSRMSLGSITFLHASGNGGMSKDNSGMCKSTGRWLAVISFLAAEGVEELAMYCLQTLIYGLEWSTQPNSGN